MALLFKDIPTVVVGAVCGGLGGVVAGRLYQRSKANEELAPPPVVAMWALENRMTEGQRKVIVTQRGSNAILDIKVIRKVCPQLGLRGAKYVVDHAPQLVCAALTPAQAEVMKQELETSGMMVEVN